MRHTVGMYEFTNKDQLLCPSVEFKQLIPHGPDPLECSHISKGFKNNVGCPINIFFWNGTHEELAAQLGTAPIPADEVSLSIFYFCLFFIFRFLFSVSSVFFCSFIFFQMFFLNFFSIFFQFFFNFFSIFFQFVFNFFSLFFPFFSNFFQFFFNFLKIF